jgi:hypothetical protein
MGLPWDGQPTASAKLVDLSLNCRGLFLLNEPDGTWVPQFGDGRSLSAPYLSACAAITDRLIMDPVSLLLVSVMAGFTFFEAGILVTLVVLERASG